MSSATSYRLSGIALLIGTALSIVYNICQAFLNGNDLATITNPLSLWSSVIGLIGSMLVLLGLPGVYTRQAGRAGILGLLGFLFFWYVILFQGVIIPFTSITIISQIGAHIVPSSSSLALATTPPPAWTPFYILSMVSQVLGILLLAIATLRARVFPRWIAWILIASLVVGVVNFLPFVPQTLGNLLPVIGGVAMAGYGYTLLSPDRLERAQPAPASAQAEARA